MVILYMFTKHKSNLQLKVDGKMTTNGADKAGLIQAIALLILATGVAFVFVCLGLSLLGGQ